MPHHKGIAFTGPEYKGENKGRHAQYHGQKSHGQTPCVFSPEDRAGDAASQTHDNIKKRKVLNQAHAKSPLSWHSGRSDRYPVYRIVCKGGP